MVNGVKYLGVRLAKGPSGLLYVKHLQLWRKLIERRTL